jgi:hypothetical protein
MRNKEVGSLTVKRSNRACHLILPQIWVLRLPNRPYAIELCMMEVKRRISRAGEGIVSEPTQGEVTGAMKPRLVRYLAIELVPVDASLKAVHIWAAQEELYIACVRLVAPE